MNIAMLLFTYNRSYHTKVVIDSLKNNKILPQKLFIFQDGLKQETSQDEWEKVNNLIHRVDWCETEVIVSRENKGLAESIVSGINYVFKTYDAIIVLEDDCVTTSNFISFMNQCLYKYEKDARIYSISGYSWPIKLKKRQYDVYGCGRISSWGWGTWKSRWDIYEKNYEIVRKMKQKAETSQNLAIWGQDLEDTLIGNVRGECDSWAVFWALNVIFNRGICIAPFYSLIKNIGMDGSGVHCGVTKKFMVECIAGEQKKFCLPDEIRILDETKRAFASLYGSYTAINKYDSNRKKVVVYGIGNFFKRNEKQVNEEYYIEKFIDRNKKGYFAGKQIIKLEEIEKYEFEKLIIMIQSKTESEKIAKNIIMNHNIPEDKIELGCLKFEI